MSEDMVQTMKDGLPVVLCGKCGAFMGDVRGQSRDFDIDKGCLVCWSKDPWRCAVDYTGPRMDNVRVVEVRERNL